MTTQNYIIGIDLGTTNCTVAYAEKNNDRFDKKAIEQLLIPQITSAGTQEECASLPSFIYFPLKEELEAKITEVEFEKKLSYCIGFFARDRGAEIPTRLISSAKSWLCHGAIDRREKILPLEMEDHHLKMSPFEALAELLKHIKKSWDFKMENAPFALQQIFVTVPASFDPSARQLVLEAAASVGYPEVILLEEPQAAFYAWLDKHHESWRDVLQVGDRVLVVDIGGGTTDFSLISVADEKGDLQLKRDAVGPHLLLGGDNFDLALAYYVKDKLENKGHILSDGQFQSLVHECRKAKEILLGENPPEKVDLTIQGRSSKLIAGTIKAAISQEEIGTLLIEGFFPLVEISERSLAERHLGLQQIGLPYAQDPRVSCQLAKFLSMTGESDSPKMDQFIIPSAILFNGGTMKAFGFRKRMLDQLNKWASLLGLPPVKELAGADFDYGVSRGAAYYGLARNGKGMRIKSGTSQSYYIGVEEARLAVPGIQPPLKAICIVPFGMEEGTEHELPGCEFALVLGEIAAFRFFSRSVPHLSDGTEPIMGTVVRQWKQELNELHPVEAKLEKQEGDGKTVRVKLHSHLTEVGTLELWCAAEDGRKWKLEFDIRKGVAS